MKNKVLDYEIIQDINLLLRSKIIIYGTSSRAEKLYPIIKRLNLNVVACCDGNKNKIGKKFHEWKIEAFTDVSERTKEDDVLIIIGSTYAEEIMADCNKLRQQGLSFLTSLGFRLAILFNRTSDNLEASFRNWYNQKYDTWHFLRNKCVIGAQQWQYTDKLLRFMNTDSILVYQMGKVGSTTITTSLNAVGVENIHLHCLQPWSTSAIPWNDGIQNYVDTIKQIIQQKEKIKIITLVREPIAREISQFFQTISFPDIFYEVPNELIDGIIKTMQNCPVFSWFDEELKETFGIDVYSYPFDKECGYTVIKQDNIDCLILKLEKLDACEDVIRDFVDNKNFSLQKDNSGNDKEYRYLYHDVKRHISIPHDVADTYYNSDAVRHFYTEKEIEEFRKSWNLF